MKFGNLNPPSLSSIPFLDARWSQTEGISNPPPRLTPGPAEFLNWLLLPLLQSETTAHYMELLLMSCVHGTGMTRSGRTVPKMSYHKVLSFVGRRSLLGDS